MIGKWLDEQADNLDATVFSGDCLSQIENREYLKKMCERWLGEIKLQETTND